jgi:hypothetical protein
MWMQLLVGFEERANISISEASGLHVVAPVGVRFQVLTSTGAKDAFALRLNLTLGAVTSSPHPRAAKCWLRT